jgi:tetratricopeptide (TPR) repeat protein
MTISMPELTEADIRDWTGVVSLERGREYFGEGRILGPRLRPPTLKAGCRGSGRSLYAVEVMLTDRGILAATCSCPVGDGGHCKHVAALLLVWVHEPGAFVELESLGAAIQRRSKSDLVALIRRMLALYPDLEELLDLPEIGQTEPLSPADVEIIRQQANGAFHRPDRDYWGAARTIARDLSILVGIGEDCAGRGDLRSAASVYRTVAQAVLDNFGSTVDEEGDLAEVVRQCVEGLGDCLAGTDSPAERKSLLREMLDVYFWDVNQGIVGMGDSVPEITLCYATPDERRLVAEWLREFAWTAPQVAEDGNRIGIIRRRLTGGFVLNLVEGQVDDEALLGICRETGRWSELADRLLLLGRANEAAEVARRGSDFELTRYADLFIRHGQPDLAGSLVRERMQSSQRPHLTEWLRDRARERGEFAEALSLTEQLFWQTHGLSEYRELKSLALPLGLWGSVRESVLSRLGGEGEHHLLTRIYLEEGQLDYALEALDWVAALGRQRPWRALNDNGLYIQVAEGVEEARPHEAIRLYVEVAERLIAARGRANYRTAVGYLARVRVIHDRVGETASWQAFVAELREHHRRLPAFQGELAAAGL